MIRLSTLAVAAGVVLLLAIVGNWERGNRANEQAEGMRSVLARVGPLDSRQLRGFRIFAGFDCLVYKRRRNDFALEVCVDDEGRVVEAIDRIDGSPEIWSLRDDPTRSKVEVDRAEVNALLRKMNVPDELLPDA